MKPIGNYNYAIINLNSYSLKYSPKSLCLRKDMVLNELPSKVPPACASNRTTCCSCFFKCHLNNFGTTAFASDRTVFLCSIGVVMIKRVVPAIQVDIRVSACYINRIPLQPSACAGGVFTSAHMIKPVAGTDLSESYPNPITACPLEPYLLHRP